MEINAALVAALQVLVDEVETDSEGEQEVLRDEGDGRGDQGQPADGTNPVGAGQSGPVNAEETADPGAGPQGGRVSSERQQEGSLEGGKGRSERPVKRKRHSSGGESRSPERVTPIAQVRPPKSISIWSRDAVDTDDHNDQIDALVYNEHDQSFLGEKEPYNLLNYALKAVLQTASVIRHVQQGPVLDVEEVKEQVNAAELKFAKVDKELADSQKLVQELTAAKAKLQGEVHEVTATAKKFAEKLELSEKDNDWLRSRAEKAEQALKDEKAAREREVKEMEALKASNAELKKKVADLGAERKKMRSNLKEIHKASFDNALAQLEVVHPGLDVGPLHYRKVVLGGKIGTLDDQKQFTPTFPAEPAP